MKLSVKETLVQGRALLARSEDCKRYYAKDREGHAIDCDSPHAVGFCILGACAAVNGEENGFYIDHKLGDVLFNAIEGDSITEFNDTHTKEECLQVFDRAIAALDVKEFITHCEEQPLSLGESHV